MLIAILILVFLSALLEGVSDKWREDYQFFLEDGGVPEHWGGGKFWGYYPFNKKKMLGRDGWHLLKYPLFGGYMAAICLATHIDFTWLLLLMPILRWVGVELGLKRKK